MTLIKDAPAAGVMGRSPPRLSLAVKRVDLVVVAALCLLAFVQSPGETSFDTKLDLLVDPVGFLARALNAWDAEGGFGQVQNQAYGYLWPMGPFFALGHSLGVPPWLVQASWMALLLSVSYLGVRRLASALGVASSGAVVGALVYALSPRMLTVLGPISAEALPVALVPWMLLPLVQEGRTLRRAAFLSALAVFMMGAANAALTVAVLPLAVLWIVLQARNAWRLLAWWSLFVGLLSMWWAVPLLLQGRYAPPFLDYIESAVATTGVVSPAAALRGSTHWVAYLVISGEPWWPAGFEVAVGDLAVIATTVLAASGLVGLAMRQLRGSVVWVSSMLTGVVLLSIGSTAEPGSPVRSLWLELLDGPLVAFRNIHKFDVLVRLPVSLGVSVVVAWAVSAVLRQAGLRRGPADRNRSVPSTRLLPALALLTGLAVTGSLLMAISPAVGRDLRPGPTWQGELPPYWKDAANYVRGREGRTLLLPGSSFGEYTWGRTVDEPLQPLADGPWAADNSLPLGAAGSSRLLDSVNRLLETGRSSSRLADLLARSGVSQVLVRNDLDSAATGAPSPPLVHAALDGSPGLVRTATFGPRTGGAGAYPALEVYAVDRPVHEVAWIPASDITRVSGGPESLLRLLEDRVLSPDDGVVLAGDAPSDMPGAVVLTDSLRLRERALGRVHGSLSATGAVDDPSRVMRRSPDLLPTGATGHQTFAVAQGVASIVASSSMAYADSFPPIDPSRHPFAAVDDSQDTWWQSANFGGPVGQWIDVTLDLPLAGGSVVADFVESPAVGPRVSRVSVTTDEAVVMTDVPVGGRLTFDLGEQVTNHLRLTVVSVEGSADQGYVGLREISIPGVRASRPSLLPQPGGPVAAIALSVDTLPRKACFVVESQTRCDPWLLRGTEEIGGIDRLVDLSSTFRGTWTASGVIRSGAAAAALFDPVDSGIRAKASSWLAEDVLVRPAAAVDRRLDTAWVAAIDDPTPTLELSLGTERRVTSVRVTHADFPAVSRPTRVRVTTANGMVESDLDLGSAILLPTGTLTDFLKLEVLDWAPVVAQEPGGFPYEAPVGISEIEITGAQDLVYSPDPTGTTGSPCGLGPQLTVDGRTVPTEVVTTLGDVLANRSAQLRVCARDLDNLALLAGRHRVKLSATPLVLPTSLVAVAGTSRSSRVASGRFVDVRDASPGQWAVTVGAGASGVLRFAQSTNDGWSAEKDGLALRPIVLDGWQQGFMVPEGGAGTIIVRFVPDRAHKAGLVAGAVLAVGGLLIGLRRERLSERSNARRAPAVPSRWASALLIVVSGALLTGASGVVLAIAILVLGPRSGVARHLVPGVLVLMGMVAWASSADGTVTASATTTVTLTTVAALLWTADTVLRPGEASRRRQPGPSETRTTRA